MWTTAPSAGGPFSMQLGATMGIYVQFPEFRTHVAIKEEVNSAIMGLLAGSQMAAHLLQLTEGSDHLLAEVFPQIPHIKRFNLTTPAARSILNSADSHLGAMAVPYVLGTHEDYLKACLKLVERYNGVNLGSANIKSAAQHEKLQDNSASNFDNVSLEQFHLVRKMRNCTIHAGGAVNKPLENHSSKMSPAARAGWKSLAGYDPSFTEGQGSVHFGYRETIATLAITKNLARQANLILQESISRESWGKILMLDLDESGPGIPKDPHMRIRKVRGYARHYYSALKLSSKEIETINAKY
ncbi:hypothetical protein ACJWDR_30355 [Streptomyces tauricus]|uniref:hypothetical protein n=1 Tax=Streptomyces tauricus TaxID=68274 RepID=UPI00387F0EC1